MRRWQQLLACAALLLAGCATLPDAPDPQPPAGVAQRPIDLREAFNAATPLREAIRGLTLAPGKAPMVEAGGATLLAVALVNDEARARTIKVKSYVVRRSDGAHVLFYPVLSFVDDDFRIRQTVKPKYEFAIERNVLTNEFDVPAGTRRILVHTGAQFVPSGFSSSTSTGSSPSPGAYSAAGVLGGAVGALILHAATRGETVEFTFGEVGLVDIEAD